MRTMESKILNKKTKTKGDWMKVVHQGPWMFHGWGLMIEVYDGVTDLEKFIFHGRCMHGLKSMKFRSSMGM
jgi:hypothetical protein